MADSNAVSSLVRWKTAIIAVASISLVVGAYYVQSAATPFQDPKANGLLRRTGAIHDNRRRRRRHLDVPSSPIEADDAVTTLDDDEGAPDPTSVDRDNSGLKTLLYRIAEDQARREGFCHRGVTCNSCGSVPIRGVRYRCSNCYDYDLCEACEASGDVHTKTHLFYKVRIPAPFLGNGPHPPQKPIYPGKFQSYTSKLPREIVSLLKPQTGFSEDELDCYFEQFKCIACTEWHTDSTPLDLAIDRKTFGKVFVPSDSNKPAPPGLIYDRVFAYYDTNRDGLIGFEEFVMGLASMHNKDNVDRMARIFAGYDLDDNGFVDRRDFLRMFRAYYTLTKSMSKEIIAALEEDAFEHRNPKNVVLGTKPLSSAFDGDIASPPPRMTGTGKQMTQFGDMELLDGALPALQEDEPDVIDRHTIVGDASVRIARNQHDRILRSPHLDSMLAAEVVIQPNSSSPESPRSSNRVVAISADDDGGMDVMLGMLTNSEPRDAPSTSLTDAELISVLLTQRDQNSSGPTEQPDTIHVTVNVPDAPEPEISSTVSPVPPDTEDRYPPAVIPSNTELSSEASDVGEESYPESTLSDVNYPTIETLLEEPWPPSFVSEADVEAAIGNITNTNWKTIEDKGLRRKILQAAVSRAKSDKEGGFADARTRGLHERWRRRGFYIDEEEGVGPPPDYDAELDDVETKVNGVDDDEPNTPSASSSRAARMRSRSSSKVRFEDDVSDIDLDVRSNHSTSSRRSVPLNERWGGFEIPEAERDVGNEILYQVLQQGCNEILDELFKPAEDAAMHVFKTRKERKLWADWLPPLDQSVVASDEPKPDFYNEVEKQIKQHADPLVQSQPAPTEEPREDVANVNTTADEASQPGTQDDQATAQTDPEPQPPAPSAHTIALDPFIRSLPLPALLGLSGYSIAGKDMTLPQNRPSSPRETHEPDLFSTSSSSHATYPETFSTRMPSARPPDLERLKYLSNLRTEEFRINQRGGPGRLSFWEFDSIMKRHPRLAFLESWVEMGSF